MMEGEEKKRERGIRTGRKEGEGGGGGRDSRRGRGRENRERTGTRETAGQGEKRR